MMSEAKAACRFATAGSLLACVLLSSGCLKILYHVQLEDDARGVVTEVVKVERKALMLEKSVEGMTPFEGLLVEERARERAKLMNAELVRFEVVRTRDGGLQSTASYAFDHISRLRLPLYPWPTASTGTYWQKALMGFAYSDDEVRRIRQLWIFTVPPEDEGDARAPADPKAPKRSTPAELQQLRRLLPIFRDMIQGFQMFVRFQIGDKKQWLQSCPPNVRPPPFTFRAWDGQYTLLSVTDKDLTFDEDAMMIVVPWEIAGNEQQLTRKLENSRYFIHTNGTVPGRSWDISRLHWEYLRVDGIWRYHGRSLPDQGVTRLSPIELPNVPPPAPQPKPSRYDYQYLGLDWRILLLKDKGAIPADFMKPGFDDSTWKKINIYVGEAVLTEPLMLYRKTFTVPVAWKGRVVDLRFTGVRDRCVVYLNGAEIGRNDGWSRRFTIDVADKVNYGGSNLLALQVENLTDKGGIWGEVDIGDTRLTSEFHLTRDETLAEESAAQKVLRAELPALPGVITFQVHRPGEPEMKENWDICTIRPDGTGLQTVVGHPAADVHPKISPDGKRILFLSLRDAWPEILKMRKVPPSVWEDHGVYYTVDVEGKSQPKRLWPAKGLGSDACWSPDGKAIAFAQHKPPRIQIKLLESGKVISHTPPEVTECAAPAFSPDGKRLFFLALDETEVEDRWGSGRVAHLDPATWELAGKKWERYLWGPTRTIAISPDGKQTAANTSHPHGGIRWEQFRWSWLRDSISEGHKRDDPLAETDLGFRQARMLPHWRSGRPERRMYNECPVWAPNSRYILFVRGPDYHEATYFQFVRRCMLVDWMDLYLADPAGKRCVRLTWLRSRMGHPDWWAPR